jgi:SSS family solute:Na+ symporter
MHHMIPTPFFATIESKVTNLDIAVTIIYMVAIVAAGCWVGIRHRRKQKDGGAKDYFLAGGTLKWPMIGMALFATNISCVHLVSLAQAGYEQGLLMGNFEWLAAFTLVLLALFFAPFYIRSKVTTLPDFLEKRYGRACRDILAGFSLVSAIIVHIGFSLLTGAIVLSGLFGVDPWISIVVIAIATALYVVVGGLMAVVFTETVETIVLLFGAVLITFFSFKFLGGDGGVLAGWGNLIDALQEPGEENMLSMLRPHGDSSGMPWYALMLGYPVLGIWYWCADQTIVQRVLGAKDENHARVGPLFASLIKILPVFLFVLPGLMFYAMVNQGMFADLSGAMDVETGKATLSTLGADGQWEIMKTSEAYTEMIVRLLPSGLTGVMAAALIAALMSTVSGALNSISTLVSYDLWKRVKPETSEDKLVLIGRISAVGAMLVAMGLVPLLGKYGSIFAGINTIIAHIAPPVTAVFFWGVFWKKASYRGALATLIGGAILGVAVFIINTINSDGWLATLPGGFMMMAFYLFIACSVILFTVSTLMPKTAGEDPESLYFKSLGECFAFKGWSGIGNYKFLAALTLGIMAVLFYIFR